MSNSIFACDACGTALFVPAEAGITGGVCTQQYQGCGGELVALADDAARLLRARLPGLGLREQPWLTLVTKAAARSLQGEEIERGLAELVARGEAEVEFADGERWYRLTPKGSGRAAALIASNPEAQAIVERVKARS